MPENVGVDNAKGKYLLFIDDDDWVAGNDYLSSMHAMADLHTVVNSNFYLVDDKPVSTCRISSHQPTSDAGNAPS